MSELGPETDFTKLSRVELIQITATWAPTSQVFLLVTGEVLRREQVEKDENKYRQLQSEKTQQQIKYLQIIMLILTIAGVLIMLVK